MRPRSNHPEADATETLCRSAGSLIQRLPAKTEVRGELPDHLTRALSKPRLAHRVRPRLLAFGLGGAALLVIGIALLRNRPLRYYVDGVAATASGRVETSVAQTARIRFTDGSAIEVLEQSSGVVVERTSDGATFTLEHGRATFDVVHRARARWRVVAGPFDILVTGTRFDLTWLDGAGVLNLNLRAGSVIVRGGAANAGISVRAGERISLRSDVPPRTTDLDPDSAPRLGGAARIEIDAAPPTKPRNHRAQAAALPASTPAKVRPQPTISASVTTARPELAAGGIACATDPPQFRFDQSTEGAHASTMSVLALSNATVARGRSWCGEGALSLDANFDLSGPQNRLHQRPHEKGGVWVPLGRALDLTDRTVTAHVYVEAPPDVRFGAELYVVNGSDLGGKWAGGGKVSGLRPGQWISISHTFAKQSPLWNGTTTDVRNAHFVAVDIFSEGAVPVWRGRVLIDDIGWR